MVVKDRVLRRFLHSSFVYHGYDNRLSSTGVNLLGIPAAVSSFFGSCEWREVAGCKGYSTISKRQCNSHSTFDILSSIRTSLNQPEDACHYWLNKVSDKMKLLKEDRVFLILVSENPESAIALDQNTFRMIEKLKALHQRYPFLEVFALLHGTPTSISNISRHLLQRVIKEYIAFPVLLSCKKNLEIEKEPCYIISKGFQDPFVYFENDVDIQVLDQAIQDINAKDGEGMKSNCVEISKEPDACSALQNLFLSFPGCISVEETGDRMFLSDVNHHRIIVFNGNGKILDAIGSSPGFEDGVFETAKLMRPAASFYNASEDCLYFVDSENHSIRRADMERRVVETIFPAKLGDKRNGIWQWILNMVGKERHVKLEAEEFNTSFLFPWHLLKSSNDHLIVLNQSFKTLWVIDLESRSVREVVKESSKIMELCGLMIMEKSSLLGQMPSDWLQQQLVSNCAFEGISYAGLMSSVATCQEHIVICDTVGQTLFKFDRRNGSMKSFHFSNFGILGLPYWFRKPLERVHSINDIPHVEPDHVQTFNLLPGTVDIEVSISIPQQMELVEQPQEGCIWRQARGTAVEVSGMENKAASTEKVGIAQQWYDELDNLSYSTPQEDLSSEEENRLLNNNVQEGIARIGCTINTSPGTSEVVIYAALYLRIKKNNTLLSDGPESKTNIISNILDPGRRFNRDLLVKLITTSTRDLEDLVIMKPLHVRLKFDSLDHPKADNLRNTVLTESSVKVHVLL